MGTSRLGGVPTVLPPPDSLPPPGQLGLDLVGTDAVAAPVHREVLPDVVHVAGWLDLARQRALADDFRRWAEPPAGLRHPRVPAGHVMTVQSVCLGWHWQPYAYSRTADDTDGAPVKPLPADVIELARQAVTRHVRCGTGSALRARCGDRQPVRPRRPARAAPGRRGAVRRPRRHDQPRRHAASSASPASTAAPARSSTSSCAVATCWCSAAPTGGSTTASRRCSTAPGRRASACRPGG